MAPKFAVNIHHDESDLTEASINFSSSGTNTLVAGVPNQIIRIYKIFFTVGGNTNLIYQDGANNLTGAMPFGANQGMILDFDTKPWFTMGIGNAFNLNSSGSVQVGGRVYYQITNASAPAV